MSYKNLYNKNKYATNNVYDLENASYLEILITVNLSQVWTNF